MNVCIDNNTDSFCIDLDWVGCCREPRRQRIPMCLEFYCIPQSCDLPNSTSYLAFGQIKPSDLNGLTEPGHKARTLAGNLNSLHCDIFGKTKVGDTFWYYKFLRADVRAHHIIKTFKNLGYKVEFNSGAYQHSDCDCAACCYNSPTLHLVGQRPNMVDLVLT